MSEPTPTPGRRLLVGVLVASLLVAALAAIDLLSDLREGTTPLHVAVEGGLFLVGLAGAAVMTHRLVLARRQAERWRHEAAELSTRLEHTRAEAARWRREAEDVVAGLAQAIDRQFDRWALSPAEKEVALLLLKGLSHKEIADVRQVAASTARQQARAVYRKAGLEGRHDLAAFFLEDLMLPAAAPPR